MNIRRLPKTVAVDDEMFVDFVKNSRNESKTEFLHFDFEKPYNHIETKAKKRSWIDLKNRSGSFPPHASRLLMFFEQIGETMKMIPLTREDIVYIYEKYLVRDFDDNERKPLSLILKSLSEGIYEGYGFCRTDDIKNSLLGYAFFCKNGNKYLVDYFAVTEEVRNQGIGTEILKMISAQFENADCMIVEVEDFDWMDTEEGRLLAKRRYGFYLRNGYIDTGIKVNLWEVQYRILLYYNNMERTKEQNEADYLAFHRAMMPPELFAEKVNILN